MCTHLCLSETAVLCCVLKKKLTRDFSSDVSLTNFQFLYFTTKISIKVLNFRVQYFRVDFSPNSNFITFRVKSFSLLELFDRAHHTSVSSTSYRCN